MESWEQDTLRAAIRERDEWKARAEAAESDARHYAARHEDAEARADAAACEWRTCEADRVNANEHLAVMRESLGESESELATLRAENERLRAEIETTDGYCDTCRDMRAENERLRQNLALSGDALRLSDDDGERAESRLAIATELLGSYLNGGRPHEAAVAFLANRPAAPCNTCEDAGLNLCPCTAGENGRGEPCRLLRKHEGSCRFYGQPSERARAEPMRVYGGEGMPDVVLDPQTRTEADRIAESPHGFWIHGPDLAELRAEAKRLGLTYSQMAQRAWLIARERIRQIPSDRRE